MERIIIHFHLGIFNAQWCHKYSDENRSIAIDNLKKTLPIIKKLNLFEPTTQYKMRKKGDRIVACRNSSM